MLGRLLIVVKLFVARQVAVLRIVHLIGGAEDGRLVEAVELLACEVNVVLDTVSILICHRSADIRHVGHNIRRHEAVLNAIRVFDELRRTIEHSQDSHLVGWPRVELERRDGAQ